MHQDLSPNDRAPGRRTQAWFQAALAVSAALLMAAGTAHAIGIGTYEVQSSLGEPLRVVVEVSARSDETVDPACFKIHPFTVANDGLPQLTAAQVGVERRGGQPRLVVSSTRPVNDPIVRLSIDIGCDTVLRRDLTLLLDPAPVVEPPQQLAEPARPVGAPPAAAASASPPAPGAASSGGTAAGGSAPAPSSARAAAGSSRSVPAARPARPGRDRAGGAPASAATTPPARAAADSAGATDKPVPRPRAAQQPPRDRLTISGSAPGQELASGAPVGPRLTLSTSLADRTGVPPLPETVLSILRQKQARLRAAPGGEDIPSMEAELVVLQKRTAELRAQLEAVMSQVQTIRSSAGGAAGTDAAPATPAAGADPAAASALVPPTAVNAIPEPVEAQPMWLDLRVLLALVLGLLIALLIAGIIVWIRRERADRRRANRWNRAPYVPAAAPRAAPSDPSRPTAPERAEAAPASAGATSNSVAVPMPESYAFMPFSTGHAARDLGVSDLAQATEKANVFVTLGRPEQAIDVLRDHIDHEPKPSPMAWLMLLDLYRQAERRASFGEVAERFHQTFNAETPTWNVAPQSSDPGIAAFPRLLRQIRANWGFEPSALLIDELLYDNRGGSRIGFSLPAFRDLLLLQAVLEKHLHLPAGVGADMEAPPPPPHLARAWAAAGQSAQPAAEESTPPAAPAAAGPAAPAASPLQLDMGLLSDARDRCALESGYPVIAEAITTRWGRPGMAEYLDKLISTTSDDRTAMLSSETLGELILLHEVASDLAEPAA